MFAIAIMAREISNEKCGKIGGKANVGEKTSKVVVDSFPETVSKDSEDEDRIDEAIASP